MIWGDMVKQEDGSPLFLNQRDAESYCENIGAQLPSGYLENLNGTNGFPDRDSDFVRLRQYLGGQPTPGLEGPKGYKPQFLPNLAERGRGEIWDRFFWTSSTHYDNPRVNYVFRGKKGGFVGYFRDHAEMVSVRCVVEG